MINQTVVAAHRLGADAVAREWDEAVSALSKTLGWSDDRGRAFGAIVGPTSRVILKPNWVMHQNKGPWGVDPLITNPKLIIAVAESVLRCGPRSLTIGDAPIQGCEIERIWDEGGIAAWAEAARASGHPVIGPIDFRRTTARRIGRVLEQSTERRDLSEYVLVNVREQSLLEPITTDSTQFRVTQYPPELMKARHRPGHHEYLIAKEMLESDIVINLPKLKTHKKAGVTAALKNLVGINGNKEFLPHHRVGSPAEGGDCYPRSNPFKRVQELLYDKQNSLRSILLKKALRYPIAAFSLASRYHAEKIGLEGAWSGNDTVWRMALDLNRVLLYCDSLGQWQQAPQRRELHLVDAVIAGQGDGPLASEPFNLGLLLAADSAAAADWVGAQLLGFDPISIPIVRESFGRFPFPIVSSEASPPRLVWSDAQEVNIEALPKPTRYPEGWTTAIAEKVRKGGGITGTTFNHRRYPHFEPR